MSDDPFELLRQANPSHPDTLVADPVEQAQAQALYKTILSVTKRRPGHGRSLLAAAAVVLAALFAVGGYAASARSSTRPAAVGCYATADTRSSELLVHGQPGQAPAAQCGELWQLGAVGTPQPAQLSECHAHDEALPVIPGPPTGCPTPGPVSAASGQSQSASPDDVAVEVLRSALGKGVGQHQCLAAAASHRLASDTIASAHLLGWTVQDVGPSTGARACTLLYIRVDIRTVEVIADPRQS
jgi:hypothetical protein